MAGIPTPHLQMFPIGRGNVVDMAAFAIGVCRLDTDPIGNFTLTLNNVVIGSRLHVETQGDGATLHDSVADSADETIVLSAYANGSPYNDLRIKVRKASSGTTYQPWETLATAVVSSNSIYVSQIPDE